MGIYRSSVKKGVFFNALTNARLNIYYELLKEKIKLYN